PNAERALDVVALDAAHRHLRHRDPAQTRALDAVVDQHRVHEVGDDPLATAGDDAALDHARLHVERVGDVDPLRPRVAARVDAAIPQRHRRPADVDPVELCAANAGAVHDDVADAVDGDPVLAADAGEPVDVDL